MREIIFASEKMIFIFYFIIYLRIEVDFHSHKILIRSPLSNGVPTEITNQTFQRLKGSGKFRTLQHHIEFPLLIKSMKKKSS